jgi:hypothetical protein
MLATIQSRTFCLPVCCKKNLKMRIYKTIILPVIMYWCETWCLTLREEHRLKVFQDKVLRRISSGYIICGLSSSSQFYRVS